MTISYLPNVGVWSVHTLQNFKEFDERIQQAIADVLEDGVPIGLVVAVLQAHATRETLRMTGNLWEGE